MIVVRNESYQLYYSHWCATTLPRDVFWGPEETLAFMESQQPLEVWLDDRWTKAGIVDMANYLNYPLGHVRSVEYAADLPAIIEPDSKVGFIRIIASIVFPDGELRIFPLSGTFDEYALAGPSSLI